MGARFIALRAEPVESNFASCAGGLPTSRGLPGGNSLFFCVAKRKVSKRKGDPMVRVPSLRCGQPAVLAKSGVRHKLAALRQVPALIRFWLRSSAQPDGRGKNTDAGRQGRAKRDLAGSPIANPFPIPPSTPSVCAEERRARRIRADTCLSAASCVRPRLDRAPQVARSEAQGRRQRGRLFLCLLSFWRRKKKVSSRRATPGLLADHHGFEAPASTMEITTC